METFTVHPTSVDNRAIGAAARALADGEVVIYPTDTLYALACDALDRRAVERLCRLRGLNPAKNTLAIVCSGLSEASEYVRIDNTAFALLRRCLPGPYTFVLPAATTLPKVFKGRKAVGLRIPASPVAVALAEALGQPLLTASAMPDNPGAGAEECADAYRGEIAVVLDAGVCPGIPTTVVDITDSKNPVVLRQGAGEFEE